MCLAIVKPAGKKVTKQHLENGYNSNSDGAGFAVATPDRKLIVQKGFFKFEDFFKAYEPYEEFAALIHFRIGTSGKKDSENCHPWRINDDMALIHNGILPIKADGNWSDTGMFTHHVIAPIFNSFIASGNPKWWKSMACKWLIDEVIGVSNKVAVMDNEGEYVIFNEKAGAWDDGVWYSNSGYKWNRGAYCGGSRTYDYSEYRDTELFPSGTRHARRHGGTTTSTPPSQLDRWKETSIPGVYVLKKEYASRWALPDNTPSNPEESATQQMDTDGAKTVEVIDTTEDESIEEKEAKALREAGFTEADIAAYREGSIQ